MMIYNPPPQKYLTTQNVKIRLLIGNRKKLNNNEMEYKFEDMFADIITDATYTFDSVDEDLQKDIDDFELKSKEESPRPNTYTMLEVPPIRVTDNKLEITKDVGRFQVTDSYSLETEIDKQRAVRKLIEKNIIEMEEKFEKMERTLSKFSQLWNIIIPFYKTNNGTKCPVVEDEYYFPMNTKFIDLSIDFMLRNRGLFLEIVPTTDEDQTWNNTTSQVPTGILKSFGLPFVDISNQYSDTVLTNSIKITFVEIEKPQKEYYNVWKCNNYDTIYKMKLNKSKDKQQYGLSQVLEYEMNKYGSNNNEFRKSEWCRDIDFNGIDNYINMKKSDSWSAESTKHVSRNIIKRMKEQNIDGLTQLDIWIILDSIDDDICTLDFKSIIKNSKHDESSIQPTSYGTIPTTTNMYSQIGTYPSKATTNHSTISDQYFSTDYDYEMDICDGQQNIDDSNFDDDTDSDNDNQIIFPEDNFKINPLDFHEDVFYGVGEYDTIMNHNVRPETPHPNSHINNMDNLKTIYDTFSDCNNHCEG